MYPTSVGSLSKPADSQIEGLDGTYCLASVAECRLMIFSSVNEPTHSGSRLRFYLTRLQVLGDAYYKD